MSNDNKNKNDDNVKLNSENHSLFIETVAKQNEPCKDNKDLFKVIPGYTKYTMYIDMFLEEHPQKLHEIYNKLWNANKNDELYLVINSYGGFIDEGLVLINIARNKFKGRTTTVLNCSAYSMGAMLFSIGDTRIAMEHCDFMYHDYSGGTFGKGGEIATEAKHKAKYIRSVFRDIIVNQKFLTKKEFKKMIIGQDFWFDTKEMCNRGIATHVMVDDNLIKAKKYIKRKKK